MCQSDEFKIVVICTTENVEMKWIIEQCDCLFTVLKYFRHSKTNAVWLVHRWAGCNGNNKYVQLCFAQEESYVGRID